MKAISIKQPWATLIALNIKPIENRSWKTNFRGKVLIHASGKSAGDIRNILTEEQEMALPALAFLSDNYPMSAIIGEVTIVDCVQNHPSVWAEKGCWNWVLEDPVFYPEPINNIKGKLSFWDFEKPV
ncbi:ASCH domain-containing protein [Sphingobacterium multivorum]|uniref:ASCH domain-containing protein n=1 Tax=Sphingobacterium multivorum TaxID=28454 RepID=UPI0028AC46BD|nr:ASCH domain-containing protein [Sphingobacterium multivorum]